MGQEKETEKLLGQQQMKNIRGKTQTLAQWADELGLAYHTLMSRLDDSKWSIEKAFTEPLRYGGRRNSKAA